MLGAAFAGAAPKSSANESQAPNSSCACTRQECGPALSMAPVSRDSAMLTSTTACWLAATTGTTGSSTSGGAGAGGRAWIR